MISRSPVRLVSVVALAASSSGVAQVALGSDPVADWLAQLASPTPQVQRSVAYTLRTVGPDPNRAAATLLQALKNADPYIRRRAAVAIGDFRLAPDITAPALVQSLIDPDQRVREQAAAALAKLGKPALPALFQALGSDDSAPGNSRSNPVPSTASYATAALVEMGEDAIPAVVEMTMMEGSDDSQRYIIRQSPAAALAAVLPYLRKGAEEQRIRALDALSELGPAAASSAPLLIPLLGEPSLDVRKGAITALAAFGPRGAAAAAGVAKSLFTSGLFEESNQALRAFGPIPANVCAAIVNGSKHLPDPQKIALFATLPRCCSGSAMAIGALARAAQTGSEPARLGALKDLGGMGAAAPVLVKHLQDRSVKMRVAAAGSLALMGPAAAPAAAAVTQALKRPDFGDRGPLIQTLDNIHGATAEVAPILVQELYATYPYPSQPAVAALEHMGVTAIPALIDSLSGTRPGRETVLQLLRKLGPAAAGSAPTLARLLSDPDAGLRSAVLGALLAIQGEAALPLFIGALQDSDPHVRIAAVNAIAGLKRGYGEVGPPLVSALSDPAAGVRENVVMALKKFDAARPVLEKMQSDPDPNVRRQATAHTPAQPKDPLPAILADLRDNDDETRLGAAESLLELGPDAARAGPQLLAGLADRNEDVAYLCALALRDLAIDPGRSAVLFTTLLNDGDVSLRISDRAHDIEYGAGKIAGPRHAKKPSLSEPPPEPVAAAPLDTGSLPAIPWPMPKTSEWGQIPDQVIGPPSATLMDIYSTLKQLLVQTGFSEPGVFSAPGGFAVVTEVERIHEDGTPYSGADRWTKGKLPLRSLSLSDYLSSLFFDTPGEFRLFVFVISSQQPFQGENSLEEDKAREMSLAGGRTMPKNLGDEPWKDRHCYVMLYHFERKLGEPASVVRPDSLALRTHLEKAGMQALAK